MQRNNQIGSWLIAIIVGISIAVIVFFTGRDAEEPDQQGGAVPAAPAEPGQKKPDFEVDGDPEPSIDPPDQPGSVAKLDDSALNPESLMAEIRAAIEGGDQKAIDALLPESAVGKEQRRKLEAFLEQNKLRIDPDQALMEVGELDRNRKVRWSLNLLDENGQKRKLIFDLERGEDRQWRVGEIRFPSDEGDQAGEAGDTADALDAADGFMRSTLAQQFERARFYVDSKKVDDVTIAAVCILFEEGAYRLRPEQPIRNLFQKDTTAGFIAKVQSVDGGEVGDIGLTLKKMDTGVWKISRVALDSLLRDYAKRLSDGDIYYTPLVRNPEGGSSLALYFGFDDAELSDRSKRQLKIVASMLAVDPEKTLQISGHADGLGTEDYNLLLSKQRASSVRAALIEFGVLPDQVTIQALGMSQPRRPNFLEDGRDNEQGRRANRRAEIYLDF